MSFREDREAQTERIAQLERELEVAQRAAAHNAKAAANEPSRDANPTPLSPDPKLVG